MFSLKHSSEPNPTNVDPGSVLPNQYGKIRTLKEDFENLKSGKSETEEVSIPPASGTPQAIQKSETSPRPFPAQQPIPPVTPPFPSQLQPKPGPGPKLSSEIKADMQKEKLTPFGTDSYFPEKSPFENIEQAPQAPLPAKAPEKKSSSLWIILGSSLLILVMLGGGFYYYWFFVKKPSSQTPAQETAETQQAPTSQTQNQESKNVRVFLVDPSAGSIEFQKAFQKMTEDFLSGASENELVEARPVDQNNQQIQVKDFISLLSANLPETVTQEFTADNYSLFAKKENGEIRTGLVFKLTEPTGLAGELAQQEKNLPTDLNSLYLNQAVPGAEPAFNSAKYKNADIRYYNFPSPQNTSLDYSVVSGKTSGYLIFATSKNTMHSILDYMSEK
jgi:flagellar basal body-associated protein FliL